MNRFEGKVALITGASRGIGLSIAERIVSEGGSVIITARKQEALDAAVATLGAAAVGVAGRSDDPEHRAAVFALVAERFGHLDHLVNNAGINPAYGPLADVGVDVMRKTFEVNVIATLEWARGAVAAGLLPAGSSIVNISSIAGVAAAHGIAFYGVTKGALITLTLQLASELAPDIRVNSVAPAVIKTDFAKALYEGHEAEAAAQYPLARLGEVADISGPVAFLLSDDAAWITGQNLVIDGGASMGSIV
jgi:NAD(P)-dependent dehydrogenase (short-subunit alcohol dehydrogenase family)